jgi:hypothetical protein
MSRHRFKSLWVHKLTGKPVAPAPPDCEFDTRRIHRTGNDHATSLSCAAESKALRTHWDDYPAKRYVFHGASPDHIKSPAPSQILNSFAGKGNPGSAEALPRRPVSLGKVKTAGEHPPRPKASGPARPANASQIALRFGECRFRTHLFSGQKRNNPPKPLEIRHVGCGV